MVRVVRGQRGVCVDRHRTMPGRGAYVHPEVHCMQQALRRGGLARTLRCVVPSSLATECTEELKFFEDLGKL